MTVVQKLLRGMKMFGPEIWIPLGRQVSHFCFQLLANTRSGGSRFVQEIGIDRVPGYWV